MLVVSCTKYNVQQTTKFCSFALFWGQQTEIWGHLPVSKTVKYRKPVTSVGSCFQLPVTGTLKPVQKFQTGKWYKNLFACFGHRDKEKKCAKLT